MELSRLPAWIATPAAIPKAVRQTHPAARAGRVKAPGQRLTQRAAQSLVTQMPRQGPAAHTTPAVNRAAAAGHSKARGARGSTRAQRDARVWLQNSGPRSAGAVGFASGHVANAEGCRRRGGRARATWWGRSSLVLRGAPPPQAAAVTNRPRPRALTAASGPAPAGPGPACARSSSPSAPPEQPRLAPDGPSELGQRRRL